MRFLLYISPEIGTYAGNGDTFPISLCGAARLSHGVGAARRGTGDPGDSAAARPQTASAAARSVARADVSRDAGDRHVGRAFGGSVRGRAGRQFVGRSAGALALGPLCRLDAAGLATPGDAAPSRGVLARVAPGRPRWDDVQPHQHAADHGDGRESADAPGTCRVCQADHRGPVGSGPAQSARRRDWSPGRIGMGAGPAAAGAAAEASVVARRSVVWGGRSPF